VFGPSHFLKTRRTIFEKNMVKTKIFVNVQKWGFERRGDGSYGIQMLQTRTWSIVT
jgi:hypothetical protein